MRWNANEMISSFLLSAAVILVVNHFITGRSTTPGNNLLATLPRRAVPPARIFTPSMLNASAFFALVAVVAVYIFMYRSHAGYEMRMCGLNREFSRYGGINVSSYLVLPMIISGALHGLGGGLMVLGSITRHPGLLLRHGMDGIAVALIAKNNPFAVIPAALLFSYLDAAPRRPC